MADVWSFGITCAEILSGEMPFSDEPKMTLHKDIQGRSKAYSTQALSSVRNVLH